MELRKKKLLENFIRREVRKNLREELSTPENTHRAKRVYNNLMNFSKTALQEIDKNTYDSEFHTNTVQDIERNFEILKRLE